ncbi:hypothetical protein [Nocardia asiatica]|uniref:hypothetical protein n=1 Tax=Nocardia asiatica TaxID=209252 RepID=UPI003EDEFF53
MTDISVEQHFIGPDPNRTPGYAFPGGRPDELPLSAALYDVWCKSGGIASQAVITALYQAVRALETEVQQLRGQ